MTWRLMVGGVHSLLDNTSSGRLILHMWDDEYTWVGCILYCMIWALDHDCMILEKEYRTRVFIRVGLVYVFVIVRHNGTCFAFSPSLIAVYFHTFPLLASKF